MKNYSNKYIFVFSAIMVIVVATVLSLVSLLLKPKQEDNVRIEQMQDILASVNISSTAQNAIDKYNEFIIESYVVNSNGEKIDEEGALSVDMKPELAKIEKIKQLKEDTLQQQASPFKRLLSGFIDLKPPDRETLEKEINKVYETRRLPVYICEKDNEIFYVFPMRGRGLWGAIWGYISLEKDFNTIYGVTFDHKSETPGLGAEIKEDWFEKAFQGKKLFEDNEFTSVNVVKGGAPEGDPHSVDAISGGTITSKGLEAMMEDNLSDYIPFFKKQKESDHE